MSFFFQGDCGGAPDVPGDPAEVLFEGHHSVGFQQPVTPFTEPVEFGNEIINPNGDFDGSTDMFTAPSDGIYLVSAGTSTRFGDDFTSCFMVDGVVYGDASVSTIGKTSLTMVMPLTAGQTVYLTRSNGNTSGRISDVTDGSSWLTVMKIG